MDTFDKETKQLVNASRTLGNKDLPVYLEDDELTRICLIVANDLKQHKIIKKLKIKNEIKNYYELPIKWFKKPLEANLNFEKTFLKLKENTLDFSTYFKNLCELHKRRIKFKMILENQPMPQMKQIVPRCLLEFGLIPSETIANWLVWRKWLYDIDNRSAQETGYLFEPILASAIGGIPYAASKSPIKRTDDPSKGRQVDCIDGKVAYEFKMRVTIAASGQGRFKEELEYAKDCSNSGYVPKLMVLDPTPSNRLTELRKEYQKYGGEAFVGNTAWKHLIEKSGKAMGIFVEKYVKRPINEVDASYKKLQNIDLHYDTKSIIIKIGKKSFKIIRNC